MSETYYRLDTVVLDDMVRIGGNNDDLSEWAYAVNAFLGACFGGTSRLIVKPPLSEEQETAVAFASEAGVLVAIEQDGTGPVEVEAPAPYRVMDTLKGAITTVEIPEVTAYARAVQATLSPEEAEVFNIPVTGLIVPNIDEATDACVRHHKQRNWGHVMGGGDTVYYQGPDSRSAINHGYLVLIGTNQIGVPYEQAHDDHVRLLKKAVDEAAIAAKKFASMR